MTSALSAMHACYHRFMGVTSRLAGGVAMGCLMAGLAHGMPPDQDCRTYASAMTITANGQGYSSKSDQTCRYNAASNQMSCTTTTSDSMGRSTTSTSVTAYPSTADFVDEGRIIPPPRRSSGTSTTITLGDRKLSSTLTSEYDSQHRLTREVGQSPAGTQTTAYTEWDAKGRPTRGTNSVPGMSNALSITYDDAARTVATTSNAGGQTMVATAVFDANGNLKSTMTNGGGASAVTTTFEIAGTDRVCR